MNKKWLIPLFVAAMFVVGAVAAISADELGGCGGITVSGANATRCNMTSQSDTLETWLGLVAVRNFFQYADANRAEALAQSTVLDSFLMTVADRVYLQYADGNRQEQMAGSGVLDSWLMLVHVRVYNQYADANRQNELAFPIGLIPDDDPPVITDISEEQLSGSRVTIEWQTNELSNSSLRYGTQPGNYTQVITTTGVAHVHTFVLDGLSIGTYYYEISSTDRSGNTAVSAERSFTVTEVTPTPTPTPTPTTGDGTKLYLPVVVRD